MQPNGSSMHPVTESAPASRNVCRIPAWLYLVLSARYYGDGDPRDKCDMRRLANEGPHDLVEVPMATLGRMESAFFGNGDFHKEVVSLGAQGPGVAQDTLGMLMRGTVVDPVVEGLEPRGFAAVKKNEGSSNDNAE